MTSFDGQLRLATIRVEGGTRAVRVDGGETAGAAVEVAGAADVGALLADPAWRERAQTADGPSHDVAGLDYATLVPAPEKIVCVGLNYRSHILELGFDLPTYPTLFAKYAPALIGANDDIVLPSVSDQVDWEAELGVVIGAPVRHADAAQAQAAIAGYTVVNDVTGRDWQTRTQQWLQGKTFEATTPVGPWLVTDVDPAGRELSCRVGDEVVQTGDPGDLVFGPVELVQYLSTMLTLRPGDLIVTGTPGGVGHARKPARYLGEGDVLTTRIEGIGECRNTCRAEVV